MQGTIRLQKFLSERGLTARRKAADLIRLGRVSVNGAVVLEPGLRIDPHHDKVFLDGSPVAAYIPNRRVLALHKPPGFVCSRTAQSRDERTVYDLLPPGDRGLVCVGRLDKDSEGLLLLSNDGDFCQRLTHPRYEHAKTYIVDVDGPVSDLALSALRTPVVIDGYRTRPARVRRLSATEASPARLEFTLHEGRKRQIRALCRRSGLNVQRLVRVKIGALDLGPLPPGKFRALEDWEIAALMA